MKIYYAAFQFGVIHSDIFKYCQCKNRLHVFFMYMFSSISGGKICQSNTYVHIQVVYFIQGRRAVVFEANRRESRESYFPIQMRHFSAGDDRTMVRYSVSRAIYVISACVYLKECESRQC